MEASLVVARMLLAKTRIKRLGSVSGVGWSLVFDCWFGEDHQNCVASPRWRISALGRPGRNCRTLQANAIGIHGAKLFVLSSEDLSEFSFRLAPPQGAGSPQN